MQRHHPAWQDRGPLSSDVTDPTSHPRSAYPSSTSPRLNFAFASPFAPDMMMEAVAIYRERFRPSAHGDRPHVMLGVNVFAADTDLQARRLFSSLQQAFLAIRTGRRGKLPAPVDDMDARLDPRARAMLDHALSCSIVGSAETVRLGLDAFIARTGADELMVTAQIHHHADRLRSFAILAEVAMPVMV